MLSRYDARGNIYFVISPAELAALGIALPPDPAEAARSRRGWARNAVDAICGWSGHARPQGSKLHRSDGLLVGPFGKDQDADLLVVNTDGSLAERSGNGLTIFAQALNDQGRGAADRPRTLKVHHDQAGTTPTMTRVERARVDGVSGFWLEMGAPRFGPDAVAAVPGLVRAGRPGESAIHCVERLALVDPAWDRSVLVNVGNPHCVTFLGDASKLPTMAMLAGSLLPALVRVAFARSEGATDEWSGDGDPCPAGINLQWAAPVRGGRVTARVFERGEGPTASSGTSATAVASAAWRAGLMNNGRVDVEMPGGAAPIWLSVVEGRLVSVRLFGIALRQD